MHNAIYNYGRMIRTPVIRARKIGVLEKTIEDVENKSGKPATLEEIQKSLNWEDKDKSAKKLRKILNSKVNTVSFNNMLEDENKTFETYLAGDSKHPTDSLIKEEILDELHAKIKKLPETEKFCLIHYIGLYDEEKKTFEEIAKMLNRTKPYVRNKYLHAIQHLKECVQNE